MALNYYLLILNTTDPNRWNCVKYARARCPKLPFGLWTIKDKKNIINDDKARPGSIAIIKTNFPWGHVAVVRRKDGRNIIIKEANFQYGRVTERCGSEKSLNILGYFNPNK